MTQSKFVHLIFLCIKVCDTQNWVSTAGSCVILDASLAADFYSKCDLSSFLNSIQKFEFQCYSPTLLLKDKEKLKASMSLF